MAKILLIALALLTTSYVVSIKHGEKIYDKIKVLIDDLFT